MPDKDAIQRGLDFEDKVANAISGQKQPGSGNKFYAPSDCRGSGLIVSCKSEKNLAWSRILRYLDEAIELSHGVGAIPALAVENVNSGDELILMRLSDFSKALSGPT